MILTPYAYAVAAGGWRTIWDWTALTTGSSPGWSGYTLRTRAIASALGGAGTKLRITCKAAAGGTLSKSYVQVAAASGDAYDFSTTAVAVTWNAGSAGYTVGTNTTQLSDEISLTFDGSRDLVFSFYFSSLGNIYPQTGASGRTNSVEYYKAGDDAATVDTSGYTTTNAAFLNKLELFS